MEKICIKTNGVISKKKTKRRGIKTGKKNYFNSF